jgi:hypothetical protein
MAICQKSLTTFHNMGAIWAGLAIAAVGAGTSAYGSSQNASATRDQAKFNAYLENKFGKKWGASAEELEKQKLDKLYDVGNIFERFEGAGAFGDTNTLENLRKAQEDFAALGAGDFTGFESQLRSIMQDNLVNTVGAGAPVGTYTNISADSVMNLRRQGLGEASAITGLLSGLSNELLGIEFGVMDRSFEQRYNIDRSRLSAVTGNSMQAAQTAGVGTQAAGGALQSIGGSIANYGMMKAGYGGSGTQGAPKAVPLNPDGSPMPGYTVSPGGYYMQTPYGFTPTPIGTPGSPYSGGIRVNNGGTAWNPDYLPEIDPYGNPVDGGVLPTRIDNTMPVQQAQQLLAYDQMGGAGYVQNWANSTLAQIVGSTFSNP